MVPNGWEVKKFGDLFNVKSGFGFKHSEYADSGTPLIKIDNVSHGYVKWNNVSYLPDSYREEYSDILLKEGDLLLALNRPITQGKLKLVKLTKNDVPSILYQRVGRIDFKTNDLEKDFYLYLLDTAIYRFVSHKAIGSDQPFISTTELKKLNIVKPPLPEQRKIAKILSTWDKANSTTERLIDNSKQQKKALMQQLLTGKKRLLDDSGKPFEGEWSKVELGKLLDYKQPTPYLVKSTDYSDEYSTPVLTAGKTFILGYSNENFGIFEEELPAIIFDDFTTASKFVDFPFKAKSSAMKILVAKQGVSIKFVYEAMQVLNYPVGGHQRHWISIFANLVIGLPSPPEQQKIASVLSNADKEIELLEQQLADLKQEKKALMQQLLTGKRRVNLS